MTWEKHHHEYSYIRLDTNAPRILNKVRKRYSFIIDGVSGNGQRAAVTRDADKLIPMWLPCDLTKFGGFAFAFFFAFLPIPTATAVSYQENQTINPFVTEYPFLRCTLAIFLFHIRSRRT